MAESGTTYKYAIKMLGRPAVLRDGKELSIKRKKCRAIIYYVANANKIVSKDNLLFTFWPDYSMQSARHSLNVYIHEIKKQAPGLLMVNNEYVWIDRSIDIDTVQFMSLMPTDGSFKTAPDDLLSLYRGDFLEGFEIYDAAVFDSWKTSETEFYFTRYLSALSLAATYFYDQQKFGLACETLEKALRLDPLQEPIYRLLMLSYGKSSDYLKVGKVYSRLKDVLLRELHTSPSPETVALYNSIITHDAKLNMEPSKLTSRSVSAHSLSSGQKPHVPVRKPERRFLPFVGRDSEMKSIQIEIATNRRGLIHIDGAAGIGKTRFLQEITSSWDGCSLFITCKNDPNMSPIQPVVDALLMLPSALVEYIYTNIRPNIGKLYWNCLCYCVPSFDLHKQDFDFDKPGTQLFVEALNALLKELSKTQRVLFVVDDTHVASDRALEHFMYLIRHCEDSDVTFISSQNSNRTNTTFEKYKQELICAGLFFSLVLKPLPNKVNIILSEKILGYENPVLADWLADKAEGNPYIITEYIRFAISYLASSSPSPKTVDDLLQCEDIPQNVTRYLNYVFAPLSHAASTLLSTAAVYGTEFDYQTVFRATDLRYENALDALDELIASGIVFHTNGNLYRFHHKTLAKVAYERIQESRRKYIHKRLSESLESTAVSRTEQEQALLIYNYIKSDQFGKASELAMQVGNASLSSGISDLAISNYKIVCNFDPLAGYLHIMDALYLLGDDSENAKQQFSKEFRMAQQVTGEALQSYTEIHHFLLSSFPLQPDFPYASQINVPDSINALCRLSYSNFDMGGMCCDSPCLALDIRTLLDVSIIFAQSGSLDDAESILSALTSVPFKNDGENSPYLLVVAKLVLGCLLLKKDDSLAKDVLLSGMHAATNIGFDVLLPLFRYNYGKYLQRNGNYDQSRTMILSACSLSEKLGRSDWTAAIKAARDSVTKHPQSPIS